MINATLYTVLNFKFKGEKMRKVMSSLMIVSLLFVGCGGGGSTDSTTTQYDMWEYIASKDTTTNTLDKYNSNSTYTLIGNRTINAGYIEYTVLSSISKQVDFNGEVTAIFTLSGNTIKINNINIQRYKSIGSKLGECTLESQHDTLTIANNHVFANVLEFNCGDYKEFYSKDNGLVATYGSASYNNGRTVRTNYFISVNN